MLTQAKADEMIEALRGYQFREGYCFICGEKLSETEESSTGVLHSKCALAYIDCKEEVVKRIFNKVKIWNDKN